MPAARAAVTPGTLSSITRQRTGSVPISAAASRNRSGAGLPRVTCAAEKTCGAKRASSAVRVRLAAIFSGVPLEATQTGSAICPSAATMPGIGCREAAKASSSRPFSCVSKSAGSARPSAASTSRVASRAERPRKRARTSSALIG